MTPKEMVVMQEQALAFIAKERKKIEESERQIALAWADIQAWEEEILSYQEESWEDDLIPL